MLKLFGLSDHMLVTGNEDFDHYIDYNLVHKRIDEERVHSLAFLDKELKLL